MNTPIARPQSSFPLPEHAKLVFKGVIFEVYQWEQKMFDGSTEIFEKLKRPDTVQIIPVTKDGTVIIVEEEQPNHPPSLGFPGGRIDEGEDVLAAAERELLEETGYAAEKMVVYAAVQPETKVEWVIYTLIATGCYPAHAQNLDAGEKISTRAVSLEELLELLNKNALGKTALSELAIRAQYDPQIKERLKQQLSLP